jgi:hypothetical protein
MKAYGTGGTAPILAVRGCGVEGGHEVQPLWATESEGLHSSAIMSILNKEIDFLRSIDF